MEQLTLTKRTPDFKKVCDFIIKNEGYDISENKSRYHKNVFPRQLAMFWARRKTRASQSEVGRYFGKDHATVLYAEKTINNYLDYDKFLRPEILKYDELIRSSDVLPKIKIKFNIYSLTRYAYRNVLTPCEILSCEDKHFAERELLRLIKFEKYYN